MTIIMASLNSSKSGAFVARKAIPVDARAEYKRLYNVSREAILKIPAGTPKAQAKALHGQWLSEVETRISRIRAAAKGKGQPLTKLNALALAGRWYLWFVKRHEGDPGPQEHWADRKEHLTERVWYPHAPVEHLEDQNADESWPWTQWPEVREAVRPEVAEMALVASFLASEGIALTTDAHILFVDAVSERLFAAYALLEQRARGDYSRDTYPDTFPAYDDVRSAVSERSKLLTTGVNCWDLFGAYVAANKPVAGTVDRWRTVFKNLQAMFPASTAGALTEADARAWKDTLVTPKRSAVTVEAVWLSSVNIVFSWALKQKHIRINPFAEVKIDVPKVAVLRETKAFSTKEAQVILRASMSITNTRDAFPRAKRWVLWLCAYSGARAGEITQLRGVDVTARGGSANCGSFYVMRLTPEAGTIKTAQARTVPIHEHLVAQGFIEFVKAQGQGPLFYNARVAARSNAVSATGVADTADPLNPKLSPSVKTRRRLSTWVRELGITDPEVGPTHGWRHTFKQIAERVGITEKLHDAITGHAAPTEGRKYGAPTVEDMAEALKKFPRYIV
jgi:integrase